MDDERSSYAEEFGLLFNAFGVPRMVGRVLGLLLISDPPERSAEDLAETLHASRGSISSSTRTLIDLGLVQRVSKPGQRRDYFRIKPGGWDEMMRREMESLTRFREMAERGLQIVESGDVKARNNLKEMRAVFAFWEQEMPDILNRGKRTWKQDQS